MRLKTPLCLLIALWSMIALATCSPPAPQGASPDRPLEVTLLYTNDFESAYDPIPAFWRDDLDHVGGVAQLATLIDEVRAEETPSFLLDAGDIFTGTLAKLTRGELPFELMMTIDDELGLQTYR